MNVEYMAKKIILDVEYENLLDKSLELENMNKSKKSYFVKKAQYDKDIKKYEDDIAKLEAEESKQLRKVKAYEQKLEDYAIGKISEIEAHREV